MSEVNSPFLYSSHVLKLLPSHALYICDRIFFLRNLHLFNIIDVKHGGLAWPHVNSKWNGQSSNLHPTVRMKMWLKELLGVGTPKIWFMTASSHLCKFDVLHPHQRKVITVKYQTLQRMEPEHLKHVYMGEEVSVILLIEEPPASVIDVNYSGFYLEDNMDENVSSPMITPFLEHLKEVPSKHSCVQVHHNAEHSVLHLQQNKFTEFVANFLELPEQTSATYSSQPKIELPNIQSEDLNSDFDKAAVSQIEVKKEEDLGIDFVPCEMEGGVENSIDETTLGDNRIELPSIKDDTPEPLLLECLVCDQTFKGGCKFPAFLKHMKIKHPSFNANLSERL